jgi:hypothetical protein
LNTNRNSLPHRWIRAAVVSVAALALITGCNEEEKINYSAEGEVWKGRITEAFANHNALSSHRFDGDIEFRLQGATDPTDSANTFLPLLGDGFAWSGTAHRDPLRLEADITLRRGEDTAEPQERTVMPLLIQDSKLYVSIPMVNQSNEYFEIDLAANGQGSPMPLDALTKMAGALDDLVLAIVSEVDPQWIRLAGEPSTLEKSKSTNSEPAEPSQGPVQYEITVTPDNAEHLEAAFRKGWSAWSAAFPAEFGAVPDAIDGAEDSFDLAIGGKIMLTVSADAYITEQHIELSFTGAAEEETDTPPVLGELAYSLRVYDMNRAPALTKTVPDHILSFEHVLRFLAANQSSE